MKNRIITISREFGSGGRTIGREVALKLCIPRYDEEPIEKIAEKSGFAQAYIKERSEYILREYGCEEFIGGKYSRIKYGIIKR